MSESSFEGQELKAVRTPQCDLCQPSQDILTSVIENEHACRILHQRLEDLFTELGDLADKNPTATETDYLVKSEEHLEMGRICIKLAEAVTELANIYKERTVQNTELYVAMSRFTEGEFNRTHASSRRNPNRQMRHELAQACKDSGGCYADKLGQNLRSHDTANVSKTDDAPAKPHTSFWKRILKYFARS